MKLIPLDASRTLADREAAWGEARARARLKLTPLDASRTLADREAAWGKHVPVARLKLTPLDPRRRSDRGEEKKCEEKT